MKAALPQGAQGVALSSGDLRGTSKRIIPDSHKNNVEPPSGGERPRSCSIWEGAVNGNAVIWTSITMMSQLLGC